MGEKTVLYFYGNWKTINGYIGEPQRTLQLLIAYLKKKSTTVKTLSSVREFKEAKEVDYKVFLFGDFPTICIRTIFCLIFGISFSNIRFIIFKNKVEFSDIIHFLKNVDSFAKIKYIISTSLVEIFLPKKIYMYFLSMFREKIFAVCFPTNIAKSKIFLSSSLEKNYLQKFKFLSKKEFIKKDVRLIYFGGDSYLRGVDTIENLNRTYKDFNFSCIGIFPFKGYLGKTGPNSLYHIYHNDKNILKKVQAATFSIFPFRTKIAGPDVPAALIESFLIGTPPIISKVLLFDILKKHRYPLVIDRISSDAIKECIETHVKNKKDYINIVNLCHSIRKDIIKRYSYDFLKVYV